MDLLTLFQFIFCSFLIKDLLRSMKWFFCAFRDTERFSYEVEWIFSHAICRPWYSISTFYFGKPCSQDTHDFTLCLPVSWMSDLKLLPHVSPSVLTLSKWFLWDVGWLPRVRTAWEEYLFSFVLTGTGWREQKHMLDSSASLKENSIEMEALLLITFSVLCLQWCVGSRFTVASVQCCGWFFLPLS